MRRLQILSGIFQYKLIDKCNLIGLYTGDTVLVCRFKCADDTGLLYANQTTKIGIIMNDDKLRINKSSRINKGMTIKEFNEMKFQDYNNKGDIILYI